MTFLFVAFFIVNFRNITLREGEVKVLRFEGIERIVVADPAVVDARVISEKGEVVLTGISSGSTVLTVWHSKGVNSFSVSVLSKNPLTLKKALERALRGIEGIKVKVAGEKVIVEGEILRESDLRKFREVMKGFPDVIQSVKTPEMFLKKMVELDVKMVEMAEGGKLKFGFGWPSRISLSGDGTFDIDNLNSHFTLSVVSGLSFFIELLALEGKVRILSNPVIVCISGESAKFTAGGEVPVPKSGGLGTVDVTWKEFGTILQFKPVVDKRGNIRLHIKAETSDLDPARSVDAGGFTMPAFIIRKSETTVNLREGDTLVIAELMSRTERKEVSKVPILGHIPVIGEAFKYRSMEKDKRKFYILVTPYLLTPDKVDGEKEKALIEEYRRMKRKMGIGVFD